MSLVKSLTQKVFGVGSTLLTRWGALLRRPCLKLLLGQCGRKLWVFNAVTWLSPKNIFIGNACEIGPDCVVDANGDGRIQMGDKVLIRRGCIVDAGEKGVITFGDRVWIGPGCYLRSSNHNFDDIHKPLIEQGHKPGTIILEDDVWLGAHVCILPNTHLEKGCIVSAGSIVSGRYPAYSIIAGNPGRVVGKREGARAVS